MPFSFLVFLALIASLMSVQRALAGDPGEKPSATLEKIKKKNIPDSVQLALYRSEYRGWKIKSAQKFSSKKDTVLYLVELEQFGEARQVRITENGKLESILILSTNTPRPGVTVPDETSADAKSSSNGENDDDQDEQHEYVLTGTGVAFVKQLDEAPTKETLSEKFPEKTVEKNREMVGEGVFKTQLQVKGDNGKELNLIPATRGDEPVRAGRVFTSSLQIEDGAIAGPGANFRKVFDRADKFNCFNHAEGTGGKLVCKIEENDLVYYLEENSDDQRKDCEHPEYYCKYEPASLTDNKIKSVGF